MSMASFSTLPVRMVTRTFGCERCWRTGRTRSGSALEGAGAYRIDQSGMSVFNRDNGLSGDTVLALFEDRSNRIWIGTNQGLDVIEDGHVTSMQSLLGSSGRSAVHLIYEDLAGKLWVATETQGLFVIDARNHPPFRHRRWPAQRLGHCDPRG